MMMRHPGGSSNRREDLELKTFKEITVKRKEGEIESWEELSVCVPSFLLFGSEFWLNICHVRQQERSWRLKLKQLQIGQLSKEAEEDLYSDNSFSLQVLRAIKKIEICFFISHQHLKGQWQCKRPKIEYKHHGYDPASTLSNLRSNFKWLSDPFVYCLEEKVKALQARVHHLEAQLVEMNSEPWRWRVQAILENGNRTIQLRCSKTTDQKYVGRFLGGQNSWEMRKKACITAHIHLGRQMTVCRCMSWFWGSCPPFRWGISGKDCGIGGSMAQLFGKNTNVLKPHHMYLR